MLIIFCNICNLIQLKIHSNKKKGSRNSPAVSLLQFFVTKLPSFQFHIIGELSALLLVHALSRKENVTVVCPLYERLRNERQGIPQSS